MRKAKTVFLLEPEIHSKRIFLQALKESDFNVISFNTFDELVRAEFTGEISGVIVSLDSVSQNELKKYFDKIKSVKPDVVTCVISDQPDKRFSCSFVRPLSNSFIRRKIAVEFYKQDFKPHDSRFDFVGVAIAASTGGPLTLQHFFSKLPFSEKAAFFLVMHAPAWMLGSYASRLNSSSAYEVKLAEDNSHIKPGSVYVAPGDFHMLVDGTQKKIKLVKGEPYNFLRPAADPMFFSVAEAFGKKSLGIVFTGMGHDGSLGAGRIKAVGGKIIVQSPDTAVIHSMPQSVIELGLADKIVPIEKLDYETLKMINKLSV